MDQSTINMIGGAALAALGWFARELWTAVKELKADLARLREHLPKAYVAKEDYRQDVKELKNMLQHVITRLDDKADKTDKR